MKNFEKKALDNLHKRFEEEAERNARISGALLKMFLLIFLISSLFFRIMPCIPMLVCVAGSFIGMFILFILFVTSRQDS